MVQIAVKVINVHGQLFWSSLIQINSKKQIQINSFHEDIQNWSKPSHQKTEERPPVKDTAREQMYTREMMSLFPPPRFQPEGSVGMFDPIFVPPEKALRIRGDNDPREKKECFQLNQLLKQGMVAVKTCPPENQQEVLRGYIKKMQEFNPENMAYREVLNTWVLSKMIYFEKKCREVKGINLSKYTKLMNALRDKIKNGLRDYSKFQRVYEFIALPLFDNDWERAPPAVKRQKILNKPQIDPPLMRKSSVSNKQSEKSKEEVVRSSKIDKTERREKPHIKTERYDRRERTEIKIQKPERREMTQGKSEKKIEKSDKREGGQTKIEKAQRRERSETKVEKPDRRERGEAKIEKPERIERSEAKIEKAYRRERGERIEVSKKVVYKKRKMERYYASSSSSGSSSSSSSSSLSYEERKHGNRSHRRESSKCSRSSKRSRDRRDDKRRHRNRYER